MTPLVKLAKRNLLHAVLTEEDATALASNAALALIVFCHDLKMDPSEFLQEALNTVASTGGVTKTLGP